MAELIGDIFRGDSWNFPLLNDTAERKFAHQQRLLQGGKDTQILHTNSEDMSSDSPTQGKVEEQSSFKTPGSKGQMRQFAAARLACTDSARLATERDSPAAAEAANGPLTEAANCQMPVGISKLSLSQLSLLRTNSPIIGEAHHTSGHAAASHQQIKLEDLEGLDLSGLKRDYSSFTGPASQPRQPKPAPRRALSFTQGSIGSAATTAAVGTTAGRRALGGASSSQAVSNSRMSTPASNVTSPPDTDVSLSDSDDLSGSDSGGLNIKRRRVVKGKRVHG
ncbi:MAG: hypothetical protein FRX49_04804 [Trebouxia sp. A1-2]|nr:MAG: hypothetical protein FRX49_04804 [Trebouxia sp. A1-2]